MCSSSNCNNSALDSSFLRLQGLLLLSSSLHSLSCQIIVTLFLLPRSSPILSSPFFWLFFLSFPLNFTGLLSDLQLSASAFKLTILGDPGNRGLHKNSFLSVLDSLYSSCVLCLLWSLILVSTLILIPSHISHFFIPCLSFNLSFPSLTAALGYHKPGTRTSGSSWFGSKSQTASHLASKMG